MNWIKRRCIGLLMRIYDSSLKIDYKKIDKKALEEWAWKSFDDKGFRSYLGYEDLKILKELSFGKDRDQYMILIGRRLQLLYLADEMRKAVELKKSEEEKKKFKVEVETKKNNN
jgi:hypothetical protein